MLSWEMLPAMRASARKRALTSSSWQPASVRILTATVRPMTVSRARYTWDMPPPRNSSSSYLPILAGSCMLGILPRGETACSPPRRGERGERGEDQEKLKPEDTEKEEVWRVVTQMIAAAG